MREHQLFSQNRLSSWRAGGTECVADSNCFQLSETVPIEYWFVVAASAVTKFNLKQILNSHINKLCHHQTSTQHYQWSFKFLILSSIDKMSHCDRSWMGIGFCRRVLVIIGGVVALVTVAVSTAGHVIVLIWCAYTPGAQVSVQFNNVVTHWC